MEDSQIPAYDFEGEYGRTLRACRVGGTVFIILASLWCAWQHSQLLQNLDTLENMVTGGITALPQMTQLASNYGTSLMGIAAFCALTCIVMMWIGTRRTSRIVYASVAGTALPFLTGLFYGIAWSSPMQTVITNFRI